MAEVLRKHHPLTSFAALQRVRNAESPESLARAVSAQSQAMANSNLWMLLALLT